MELTYRGYRKVWESAYGLPHPCVFCELPVTYWSGRTADGGTIHHLDEDRTNNDISNLALAHLSCHASHHRRGKPLSDAHRAAIRLKAGPAARKRSADPEYRRRLSESLRGHTVSEETRRKMSALRTGKSLRRVTCPDCQQVVPANWMTRHRCDGPPKRIL